MRTFLSTRAVALIGGALVLVIGGLYLYALDAAARAEARDESYRRVIGASVVAERRIERAFSAAATMAVVLQQNGGRVAQTESLAAQLLRSSSGLGNLQIAPLGRVRAVYPPGQAADLLGKDLARDPAWRAALAAAADARTLTGLPPRPLAGGRYAASAAMPVFVRERGRDADRLWGFVLAEIDLQELLDGLGLRELLGKDTRYAFATDTAPPQILTASTAAPEKPIVIPLSAPGIRVQLMAQPARRGIRLYGEAEMYLMLALLLALSAMMVLITVQRGQMQKLALYDGLTGLPNRRLYFDRAAQALARARRLKTGVGVLFVDVDQFKSINDRFGHDAGDAVLRHIAARLRTLLRESDVVARLSGDEFVLLLPDVGARAELDIVAQKIKEAMREPAVVRGGTVPVNVSTGASLYPADGEDVDTLLKRADERMYRAKRGAAE